MATVNFSVPSEVKDAFDKAFKGKNSKNKSAVLSNLMRQAVAEQNKKAKRAKIIAQLLALRKRSKPVRRSVIRAARRKGCPRPHWALTRASSSSGCFRIPNSNH